jgi:hypothetical protein
VTSERPFTKWGYFREYGGWLRGVCLPTNIVRSGGERDAEVDDPYSGQHLARVLSSIVAEGSPRWEGGSEALFAALAGLRRSKQRSVERQRAAGRALRESAVGGAWSRPVPACQAKLERHELDRVEAAPVEAADTSRGDGASASAWSRGGGSPGSSVGQPKPAGGHTGVRGAKAGSGRQRRSRVQGAGF